jgi:hypothetical protein
MDWSIIAGTLLGVGISTGVQLVISNRERADKFKLAALEKRLEVHQKAFSLWYDLMWSVNKDEARDEMVKKCDDFWKTHCLYLDEKSREAFRTATIAAPFVHIFENTESMKKEFNKVRAAGKAIVEGVNLPFLGEPESKKQIENQKQNESKKG